MAFGPWTTAQTELAKIAVRVPLRYDWISLDLVHEEVVIAVGGKISAPETSPPSWGHGL